MRIGIDASRAFLKQRTGIEEYSYQVIKHLRTELSDELVTLYVQKKLIFSGGWFSWMFPVIDFEIPKTWEVKGLWAPRFWTQVRLSLEMFFSRPNVLFVPAHTVPMIHPRRTIVTVHGLEYEYSPESYSFFARWYMRLSIRYSVRMAERIIAVSENTKRDLTRLYHVSEKKISVIHEGFSGVSAAMSQTDEPIGQPFFFFIGRLETRKNVVRIIEAFEIFKTKTGLPYRLVLAGKPGYGYEKIEEKIQTSRLKTEISLVGYVSELERWQYMRSAAAFLFPSLYEGFGLPVIEAQSVGVPVITTNTSSLPEIAGEGAVYVDPMKPEHLAEAMETLVRDPEKRADIIGKATRNASRFSWVACAREVVGLLMKL